MKAKIKKTGEIVNVDEYITTVYLEKYDSYGNPISMCMDDIEFIHEQTEDEHWQDIRERAAIAAMQGMLADSTRYGNSDEYAEAAVAQADALIELLKKKP